ncbi:MAG: DUF86 domain-containing protein [Patescibacteria group bacterium]
MKKDPKIFLLHIFESIKTIEGHAQKINKKTFSKNITVQDAVIRRIEVIGEAVKNLPSDYKKKHPEINWNEIVGMRNNLIHEYFGVNLFVVWQTINKDIPQLKNQISKLLEEYK